MAPPSRSRPSTSTSGPPIMKSVCTCEMLTPSREQLVRREPVGPVDCHRQARAVRDVARGVLVEQRVLEHEPGLPDGRAPVDERHLTEVGRLWICLELAADEAGPGGRRDVDDLAAAEPQLEIADDRADGGQRHRRPHRSLGRRQSGEVKTSSVGRFGMCSMPSTVVNAAHIQREAGIRPTKSSVPGPRKRIASKRVLVELRRRAP